MAFHRMVDMRRTPAEKAEKAAELECPPEPMAPDYPFGLQLTLGDEEFEKLDLDDECEVGDMIHLFAMATVTGVSMTDGPNGRRCRVELQITHLEIEDEDEEEPEDAAE